MEIILTFLIISVSFFKSGLCKCPIIKNDETCDGDKVKIALSTKSDSTQRFVYNDFGNLWHLDYDPWAENKILIHGYHKLLNDSSYLNLIEDLVSIEVDSINIFSVDYSYFVREPCATNATALANYIGKCVAELVSHLREINFPLYPQFHAVGDTFGATVLHYSAKHLKDESFEQITAFNPSYVYLLHGNSEYLDKKDAQFVDIWISNIVYNDTLNSTGHVILFLSESNRTTYLENYVESIKSSQGFFSYKCNSSEEAINKNCSTSPTYVITGETINKDLRGLFWVDTRNKTKYTIGTMGELIPTSSSTR